MRGQAFLRGLELPKRWTAKDLYLQHLLESENTRRFDELNAIVDTIIATLPVEDRKGLLDSIDTRVKRVLHAFFPHLKKKMADAPPQQTRDQQGLNALANVMKAMGQEVPKET